MPTSAPSTTNPDVSRNLPRSAARLVEVIEYLNPGGNPRYVPRDTSGDGREDTHCDAFPADVAQELGCILPYRVGADGEPVEGGGRELSANGTAEWLERHGGAYGWRALGEDAAAAQRLASEGHLVLATYRNPVPGRSGHEAVVRPGTLDPAKGPMIAQAGRVCFNAGRLVDGFGRASPIRYFATEPDATRKLLVAARGQVRQLQHALTVGLAELGDAANTRFATLLQAVDQMMRYREEVENAPRRAAERAVAALNTALQADPVAVNAFINFRLPCTEALAEHATIQVRKEESGGYSVVTLGLLNGVIGIIPSGQRKGWGYVTAMLDEHRDEVIRFEVTPE